MSKPIEIFPQTAVIEDIPVVGFPNFQSLFARLLHETRQPGQTLATYLNVHVANTAFWNKPLKKILQNATFCYCDGAGIQVAARMLGEPELPIRLPAANWTMDLFRYFGENQCKLFLLGGEPSIPEKALEILNEQVPYHSVVGVHHGYILKKPELETEVIETINRLQPDILIVGFGTPLQEDWVERNRHRLNVSVIWTLGAFMDYMTGKVSRCPRWMGKAGFEWLYRLAIEPKRMAGRYVVGNPWFLLRIALVVALRFVQQPFGRPASQPTV